MPNSTPWNDFGKPTPQENATTPTDNPLGIDSNLLLLRTEALEKSEYPDSCAYIAAAFVNATLPHSAQSAGIVHVLQNGSQLTKMVNPDGLPYGSYARLILLYFTKLVLRRAVEFGLTIDLKDSDPKEYSYRLDQARRVPVAGTIAGFMREMGAGSSKKGSQARVNLRKQLVSLMTTTIYTYGDRDLRHVSLDKRKPAPIADDVQLWWERTTDGPLLSDEYPSVIEFNRGFFEDMAFHAVPVDPAHVAYLKRSPLALDVYFWTTYRLSYTSHPVRVTWNQLRGQFGAGYPDTLQGNRNFTRKMRKAMEKIHEIWPTVGLAEWDGGVIISGKPAITQIRRNAQLENRIDPMF